MLGQRLPTRVAFCIEASGKKSFKTTTNAVVKPR